MEKAAHRHAVWWLALFAFVEASFFPIPPHPLLGLMCLAEPKKALRFAAVATAASVLGGLLGYAIGHYLFATVGSGLLSLLGLTESFPRAACYLRDYGAEIILVKGATPIPFKLITITSGVIGLSLFTFIWASMISRAMQFMLVGVLFWKFGAPIKVYLERYLGWITAVFAILLVGGVLAAGALSGGTGAAGDRCSSATMAQITGA
jgi:membrane protein YqaA with SNARE-associated domain